MKRLPLIGLGVAGVVTGYLISRNSKAPEPEAVPSGPAGPAPTPGTGPVGPGVSAPPPSPKPVEGPAKAKPTLRSGAKGDEVKNLQILLNASGAKLTVDAIFGPKTLEAVKAFQKNHKDQDGKPLIVDGVVGPKTWWALFEGG